MPRVETDRVIPQQVNRLVFCRDLVGWMVRAVGLDEGVEPYGGFAVASLVPLRGVPWLVFQGLLQRKVARGTEFDASGWGAGSAP
jgi:hypothetical protein